MTTTYATRVTEYFAARVAAYQAGSGARANFPAGTLVVGDGNGATPTISAMLAAGGVTHEVWRGQTIGAVQIDPDNPQQIDIECIVPAAIGDIEIGPFMVREFAILDETGALCVVGTTLLEKTTSAQGQISDLAWIAAIVVTSTDAVIVTPPGAGFASKADVTIEVTDRMPTATAPLTQADTNDSLGRLHRAFGLRAARQPVSGAIAEADASGYGRPATDAEFAAGAAAGGGFQWPWPTLQQVRSAVLGFTQLSAGMGIGIVTNAIRLAFHTLAAGTPAGADVIAYSNAAGDHKKTTISNLATLIGSLITPPAPLTPFGYGVGQLVEIYHPGGGAETAATWTLGETKTGAQLKGLTAPPIWGGAGMRNIGLGAGVKYEGALPPDGASYKLTGVRLNAESAMQLPGEPVTVINASGWTLQYLRVS